MTPFDRQRIVRRPRLEPLLALMGASTGLTVPIVADHWWPIAPVAYSAAALGAVAGVLFALALRASQRLTAARPHGVVAKHPWLPPVALWVGAAAIITILVSLGEGWDLGDEDLWLGGLAGALAGVATFPFGWWLLRRSVRAERARRGSLVAGADVRSLWSVAGITLAAECALALPRWTHLCAHYRGWPPASLGHAAVAGACALGVAIVLADLRASRRIAHLAARRDALEALDPLDGAASSAPSGVDLGLGDEVFGRVEVEAHYRGPTRRIPAVVGDPQLAAQALEAALLRSSIGAMVLIGLGLVALANG